MTDLTEYLQIRHHDISHGQAKPQENETGNTVMRALNVARNQNWNAYNILAMPPGTIQRYPNTGAKTEQYLISAAKLLVGSGAWFEFCL